MLVAENGGNGLASVALTHRGHIISDHVDVPEVYLDLLVPVLHEDSTGGRDEEGRSLAGGNYVVAAGPPGGAGGPKSRTHGSVRGARKAAEENVAFREGGRVYLLKQESYFDLVATDLCSLLEETMGG